LGQPNIFLAQVAAQEYELAARLRDQLKVLRAEL
jgi:protein-arginine kinase activator protein McsA